MPFSTQSVLQGGALLIVGTIAILAACQNHWDVAGTAMAGLFALLNLNRPAQPSDKPTVPADPTPPQTGA